MLRATGHARMVTVYVESLHTIFAVVYRPPDSPDSDFSNCMDKLQEMINDHSKDDRHSDVTCVRYWRFQYASLQLGRECSFHEPTQWSVSKAHDIS